MLFTVRFNLSMRFSELDIDGERCQGKLGYKLGVKTCGVKFNVHVLCNELDRVGERWRLSCRMRQVGHVLFDVISARQAGRVWCWWQITRFTDAAALGVESEWERAPSKKARRAWPFAASRPVDAVRATSLFAHSAPVPSYASASRQRHIDTLLIQKKKNLMLTKKE